MKNIYFSICLLMACTISNAQITISFEPNEGYSLGTLNDQNGWEITDDNQGSFYYKSTYH